MSWFLRSIVMPIALGGCGASQAPPLEGARAARDVGAIHRARCGACHVRVEPGTRTRAQLEDALGRHRKRVRMSEAEWSKMVDYLAERGTR